MSDLRSAEEWCVESDTLLSNYHPDVALVRDIQRNALEAAADRVKSHVSPATEAEIRALIPNDPPPA